MNDDVAILELIVEWIWLPLGSAVVWTIFRMLGFERNHQADMSRVDKSLAVVENNQAVFKERLKVLDIKNGDEHQAILDQLHGHHHSINKRLDDVLLAIRNGNGSRQK